MLSAAVRPLSRAARRASALVAARRAASSQAGASVLALGSNLSSVQDVQDLVISYGVKNAAVPGVVRPLAVVKVGGEVITKDIDNLVASLKFLYNFGLQPVVIHGGGPQLNDELAKAGVKPEYIGGHRVTDEATMKVAKRVFEAANGDLAAALRKGGLETGQLLGGIFRAEVADPRLGLVGEIRSVHADPVNEVIAAGKIPVLTSLGLSDSGSVLNINADVAARELAVALKPMKIVYISAGGGWKEDGAVIGEINMAQDYERMVNRDYTGRQGTLLKLKEMKQICDKLPPSSSVTIASAAALASCLLPHRGPGTQIRRGQRINVFNSAGSTDRLKLEQLLTGAGAEHALPLVRATDGVAPGGGSVIRAVVATDDYSGAAVVADVPGCPLPVVAAMALTPLAYAEGTEAALWTELRARFPGGLAWRAPATAPVAEGAKAVREGGPAAIPRAFPPLGAARSATQAAGSHAVPGGGAVMWTTADAAAVPAIVAALGGGAGSAAPLRPVVQPSPASAAGGKPLRVGLLGARGYVGRELVRLLGGHPSMQVVAASSRALVGQDVLTALGVPDAAGAVTPGLVMSDVGPEQLRAGKAPDVDVWVLALPNGLCAEHAAAIDARYGAKAPLLIDLSADMRFDGTGAWAYGLPERPGARDKIRAARRIANPGCYATGAQAALLPLLPQHGAGALAWDLSAKPHIFGVSGYSGAGTSPSDKNDPNKLRDNLLPYALTGHIHEREIGHHCGAPVAFMPHVAPFFQGISLTVTGHLRPSADVTPAAIRARFVDFYRGERLMRALPGEKDMPDVRTHGSLAHGVTVGGFTYDAKTGRLALVSVIDNLLKGAATQALQNMNLALGCGEYDGIPLPPQ